VNHPEYLERLFKGQPVMHKDDRSALRIEQASVRRPGETEPEFLDVVLTPEEPVRLRYQRLAAVIRRKSNVQYQPGLHHVNLIVRDRYDLMGDKRGPYSVGLFMNAGVRDALLDSPFHDVYWITVTEDYKQVYRSLRMLLMFEQFYSFGHSLQTWHNTHESLEAEETVLLFADYCDRSGIDVDLWEMHGKPWVLHRAVAIGLDDNGAHLFDNRDDIIPDSQHRPRLASHPRLTDSQFAAASSYIRDADLSTEHYYDAAVPAQLAYPRCYAVRLKPPVEDGDQARTGV
jgi:hypothetical protein